MPKGRCHETSVEAVMAFPGVRGLYVLNCLSNACDAYFRRNPEKAGDIYVGGSGIQF